MQSPNSNSSPATPTSAKLEWMPKLEQIAVQVCQTAGCELYDLEFVGAAQGRTLRIYIDKADGFIGVEDCTNVSRGLSEVLEANEDLIPGDAYNLEVSSPGLERNLRVPGHFKKVVGQNVWWKFNQVLESFKGTEPLPEKFAMKLAKQVTAELLASDDNGVRISVDGVEFAVPWSGIDKAKSVFDFDKKDKKDKQPDKKKKR